MPFICMCGLGKGLNRAINAALPRNIDLQNLARPAYFFAYCYGDTSQLQPVFTQGMLEAQVRACETQRPTVLDGCHWLMQTMAGNKAKEARRYFFIIVDSLAANDVRSGTILEALRNKKIPMLETILAPVQASRR